MSDYEEDDYGSEEPSFHSSEESEGDDSEQEVKVVENDETDVDPTDYEVDEDNAEALSEEEVEDSDARNVITVGESTTSSYDITREKAIEEKIARSSPKVPVTVKISSPLTSKMTEEVREGLVGLVDKRQKKENDANISDFLNISPGEGSQHYAVRRLLTQKISESRLGLDPLTSITVANMIMQKLTRKVGYEASVELLLDNILRSVSI